MTLCSSLSAGRARNAGRTRAPKWAALLIGAALAAGGTAPARAQLQAPPHNVVSLAASATLELTTDWLTIVFSTTRDGPDAAGVQAQLRQALDSALEEARKVARPGELNARTGGFSLVPRHAPQGAGIVGWQGSAEMVVEGRDTTAISQLAGRVRTLGIGRVGWSLSREAREKVEGEVAAQAIARFRAKADLVARQFGFASWTVREVNLAASDQPGVPPPLARMQAMRAASDESLPVEAGKALVSATVSGSVQMMK
jgi:predicted secreted protein